MNRERIIKLRQLAKLYSHLSDALEVEDKLAAEITAKVAALDYARASVAEVEKSIGFYGDAAMEAGK